MVYPPCVLGSARGPGRAGIGVSWALVTALGACDGGGCGAGGCLGPSATELADALYVSPTSYDFSKNPRLLARIEESPHGYFRFVNAAFARVTCKALGKTVVGVPSVNLHGDAHLEQYAVTDLGRGLTDFDDSSKGPAFLDLARFGTSIELALDKDGDGKGGPKPRPIVERFLDGYRDALDDPDAVAPEPQWVEGIRKSFSTNRERYFEWVGGVMKPVSDTVRAGLAEALGDYIEAMRAKHEELPAGYFDIVDVGALDMGIGSALDDKYLVRVQGQTDDPLDDVVLELKEVRTLGDVGCIEGGEVADPFRILISQSRIAYVPYASLGYINLDGKAFWIHSWVDNYREVDIDRIVSDPEHLEEVVYDVGVQLGRGHPKIAAEFELQIRRAELRWLSDNRERLLDLVDELADATRIAWKRFVTERDAIDMAGSGPSTY